MEIKLSILICSIPSRYDKLLRILNILSPQCNKEQVELLVITDNRKRSIGEKRNDLKNLAKGRYIVYVDDDDIVSTSFVRELLIGIKYNKDCIVFKEEKIIGNIKEIINYSISYDSIIKKIGNNVYKKPNSRMCIKKDLVEDINFVNENTQEDDIWGNEISSRLKSEHTIDKVLYYYTSDYNNTSTRQISKF